MKMDINCLKKATVINPMEVIGGNLDHTQAMTCKYDANNRLVYSKLLSRNNPYEQWFEYDKNGKLIKVTDSRNVSATLSYDERGNLVSKIYSQGYKYTYEYDEDNRLVHGVFESTAMTPFYSLNDTEDYSDHVEYFFYYDENGNIISKLAISNGVSTLYSYSYDSHNNLLEIHTSISCK